MHFARPVQYALAATHELQTIGDALGFAGLAVGTPRGLLPNRGRSFESHPHRLSQRTSPDRVRDTGRRLRGCSAILVAAAGYLTSPVIDTAGCPMLVVLGSRGVGPRARGPASPRLPHVPSCSAASGNSSRSHLGCRTPGLPVTWMRGDFTARGKHARVAMPEWRKK